MNVKADLNFFGILFFSGLICCSIALAGDELEKTSVAAEVNGAAITRGEVDAAVSRYLPQAYYHSGVSGEKKLEAEKKALEGLIERELFFQEAKKQHIRARSVEVNQRLDEIKKAFPSNKAFKDALKQRGTDIKTLKRQIRRDILIKKLREKEIDVHLTDKDVAEYYKKNTPKFKEPESISLKYIFIQFRPTEPDFEKKAKKKADEVLAKLRDGDDFAALAWSYSDHASKVKGGDLGYFHKGMLDPEIEKAAHSLEKGGISGLIRNDLGYHIIKVEDIKPSRQVPYDEIKDKLKKELTGSYEKKNKENLTNRLRESATIKYY
ncbi:foldase protein PrsA 1 precursor [bacterium BMS3Abin10]|nr:foldase protein PrsA 1 precursor [bacterium BMS3Abin10]GBE39165.1 foldase protein PrsA 1 precursor [bacterium BMS3Bbin08]